MLKKSAKKSRYKIVVLSPPDRYLKSNNLSYLNIGINFSYSFLINSYIVKFINHSLLLNTTASHR